MAHTRRLLLLSVILGSACTLMACATAPAPATIADTALRSSQLSTFSKLVQDAGLGETLRGVGPYTVFAPSNEAFVAVPAKTMAELAANKELLKSVLSYHLLPGRVSAGEVRNASLKTLQGANVGTSKAGTFVTVEDALVTQADIAATNGVVHIIDKVLMPRQLPCVRRSACPTRRRAPRP